MELSQGCYSDIFQSSNFFQAKSSTCYVVELKQNFSGMYVNRVNENQRQKKNIKQTNNKEEMADQKEKDSHNKERTINIESSKKD